MAKLEGRDSNGGGPSEASMAVKRALELGSPRFVQVVEHARSVGAERRRHIDAITDPVMKRSAERA